MAKKIYGSVGELSDNVVKIYGSVNRLSKNVIKGYCSVNGLSKLYYESNGSEEWSYKSSISEKLFTIESLTTGRISYITKKNEGLTYYGLLKYKEYNAVTDYYTAPILFSKTSAGVEIVETAVRPVNFSVEIGDYWYYGIPYNYPDNYQEYYNIVPECWLTNEKFNHKNQISTFLAEFIRTRIYPFEN